MKLSFRRFSGSTRGAASARRQWPGRSGLLVEFHAGSNRGLGEASPLPGFSPDTLEEAERALHSLDLSALERTLDIEDTGEALRAVANLVPPGQPAARMALEAAALDLRGQMRRLSAPALLGAEPGAERALAWLVGARGAGALPDIRRAQRAGYQHFKIKVGRSGRFETEMAAVRELRRTLGARPRLRLDANHGWSVAEARAACKQLEALDIEFIEEPCARFSRAWGTRMPVALDESLQGVDPAGLGALARRSGAGFVILKPMILGGLCRCLELARHAGALDLGIVVSHSFDGPVALAAASALALVLPTRLAQGLAPHAGLAAWPEAPSRITHAVLRTWSTPGLGLAADLFG